MRQVAFGNTGLTTPPLIFGSTALGNLFRVFSYESKLETMRAIIEHLPKPVVIDSAGKYGAGLALEVMGDCLRELGVKDDQVIISNKLAWLRAPLTTPEPTFEPGAWFGLQHDAVQDLSYDGIFKCFEQGLDLLGGDYSTQLISVHDPDEYLDAAESPADRERRFDDILGAYTALGELKSPRQSQRHRCRRQKLEIYRRDRCASRAGLGDVRQQLHTLLASGRSAGIHGFAACQRRRHHQLGRLQRRLPHRWRIFQLRQA